MINVKDNRDEERKIREARAYMKAILKSIGMICQNNEVDETFKVCTKKLLDVFLCKPLLTRVFSQNLGLDQLSSPTQLFYMPSLKYPLGAFLPKPLLEVMIVSLESSLITQILNVFFLVERKYSTFTSQFFRTFVQTTPFVPTIF